MFRAGYGKTFTPLPWSRPMRGRFPLTIAYSDAGPNGFIPYGNVSNGIPGAPNPDISTGNVPLPRGVDMTSPDPNDVSRGATQSWNAFIERRLPLDIAVSVGYVGTRTDGQYADQRLELRGVRRQRQSSVVRTGGHGRHQHASPPRRGSRYNSLQVAVNRPFKNGLLLKGAYTLSKAMNEVDDDGGGYTWAQPSQFSRNYALAGFDRPHMLQMGFVYELPFARDSIRPRGDDHQGLAGQRHRVVAVGTPFTIGGDNGLLQQQGGSQTINVTGDPKPGFGEAGPDEQWYDPTAVLAARQRMGEHRAQRVPRTGELEPRLLGVPDDPVRPLPHGDPCRVAERVQPRAVRQPGDGLH